MTEAESAPLSPAPPRRRAGRLLAIGAVLLLVVAGIAVFQLVPGSPAAVELSPSEDLLLTPTASLQFSARVTDARGAITFMNGVAESVTGWPLEEARHRPVEEVFKIINEDSRQPVEDPAAKVIKHGVIADAGMFAYLEENISKVLRRDGAALEYLIPRNAAIKAKVSRSMADCEAKRWSGGWAIRRVIAPLQPG